MGRFSVAARKDTGDKTLGTPPKGSSVVLPELIFEGDQPVEIAATNNYSLRIEKLSAKASFRSRDGSEVAIYRWSGGGIRVEVSGEGFSYLPIQDFKDFEKRMLSLLKEKLHLDFTTPRELKLVQDQIRLTWTTLKLRPGNQGPSEEQLTANLPVTAPTLFNSGAVGMNVGSTPLVLERLEQGVQIRFNGLASRTIQYRTDEDLKNKLVGWFVENVGPISTKQIAGFHELVKLGFSKAMFAESSGEPNVSRVPKFGRVTQILEGTYKLDERENPVSYLLVRNKVTKKFYCLGFVQSTLDMLFGSGASERLNLLAEPLARDVSLKSNPNFRTEKFQSKKHSELPVGTVIRFERPKTLVDSFGIFIDRIKGKQNVATDEFTPHIGIVTAPGRVTHLVGAELRSEPISKVAPPYKPFEVAIPQGVTRAEFVGRHFGVEFREGISLGQISEVLALCSPEARKLKPDIREELLYQLNRDAFELQSLVPVPNSLLNPAWMSLKRTQKILIPKDWAINEPAVQSAAEKLFTGQITRPETAHLLGAGR
jgi:hypothetical protein